MNQSSLLSCNHFLSASITEARGVPLPERADITPECSLTIPTVSPNVTISGKKISDEHIGVKRVQNTGSVFSRL